MNKPPKKLNYFIFVVIILMVFFLAKLVEMGVSDSKLLFGDSFHLGLPFLISLIVLICFSWKYYFYKEKENLYLKLPLLSIISFFIINFIIERTLGGEINCGEPTCVVAGFTTIFYFISVFVMLIITSLIIAYLIRRNIKK